MKDLMSSAKKSSVFPIRTFLAAVALVCAGLAASAWYGYELLLRLSHDYLNNRGQMVAAGIDSRMRGGPGRRANLEAWSEEIDRALESSGGKIVFMRLLDAAGETMVAKGAVDSEAKPDLYVYEYPLPTPRGGGMGAMASGRNSMPGHIRLGITSTDADFIRRQARVQLGVSGIAIVLMIGLSYYFLRTLQRFVALQAREDAERHLRSLGTMAATLAHEIRNPLGAMKGLTQLAQEGLPGSHSAQPMMNTVVSEAERLERLVTDLLTFAKPPQPQFVRFDVAGLLADLKSMLQGQLEDAHVVLEIDAAPVPLEIESDDSGLRQVLLNVIFNALDVSPRNSKIRVRAGLISSGRELVLDVEDSGPGLGDRDSEELFQPFATTKTHGTGLGLAVSRRIINSLGGSLTLASRPEGGARCSIRIPVARANSPDQ